MRSREELKKLAFDAIDKRHDAIIAFADSVYEEPELGFKEVKTAKKFSDLLSGLGYDTRTGIAVTGVVGEKKGAADNAKVAVMGELDAIIVPGHKDADPMTGACHACGHNTQLASVAAVAYALADTDIMNDLGGSVKLMAVPGEEYIELTYRYRLREEGKLWFLSGKEEFIRLGELDDIDAALMQHIVPGQEGFKAGCTAECNGFVAKLIKYTGKEAHAGAAPFDGINALNAAMLGLMGVNANRESFRDEDHIRIHPIITKGGDVVNVVPADVRLETYVRGSNVAGILDASAKMNNSLNAGAMAVGAKCDITELPGYLPVVQCDGLIDIMYDNLRDIVGEGVQRFCAGFGGGSTDFGDVASLIPGLHSYFAGASGGLHQESYRLIDKENAVINAGKALAASTIDLLYGNAEKAVEIKKNFKPAMTKEEYLRDWGRMPD